MIWHQLIHAVGGSLGIALLLAAYLYWRNRDSADGKPLRAIFLVSVPTTLGLFSCLWTLHSALSTHKAALADVLGSGQGSSNTATGLALGLLGLVMTLVTIGVVSISRSAIEDMRKEREAMKSHYSAIKSEASNLDLTQYRMQLIYENGEELKTLMDDDGTRNFREPLQVYYAGRGRNMLSGYLEYLKRFYNRETHGPLMGLEKKYLLATKLHYRTFPESDPNGEIVDLVDAVIEKL